MVMWKSDGLSTLPLSRQLWAPGGMSTYLKLSGYLNNVCTVSCQEDEIGQKCVLLPGKS